MGNRNNHDGDDVIYVEHVFEHPKNRYGLFIRTIGLARAKAKLTLANLAYNFDRFIFHQRCTASG